MALLFGVNRPVQRTGFFFASFAESGKVPPEMVGRAV